MSAYLEIINTRLNLPIFKFRFKYTNNKPFIFDEVRKKFILLTPEEWVRQNFIRYLIECKGYPKGVMSIEKEMVIHGLKKRYDLVIVDSFGNPKILVECKQSNVKINEETFFQIMKYNLHLKVNHFFLTNGLGHFYLKTDSNNKTSIYEEIPNYSSI